MYCSEVDQAVLILQQGGVVAHATEGVWGLACDPWNESAVNRILKLKQRSIDLGFIVIGSESATFQAELDSLALEVRQRVEASWPGHVTWILPTSRFPVWVTGNRTSIAARIPDHQQARNLAKLFGTAIISTSANISGKEPAKTVEEVNQQFGLLVDLVVPGQVGSAVGSSRIFNAVTEEAIR